MYKVLGYANKMAKSEVKKMIVENCKKYNENLNLLEKNLIFQLKILIKYGVILNYFYIIKYKEKERLKKIKLIKMISNLMLSIEIF